ncbi:uncharacterized protein si:dkey-52l18.4 [Periophthalmus magnuspinnatus]|uniref:uncharacterized protein si:dkey-52l18.4 n=1 Tax=Periophthalmus magnuspinnatus TaxID=409849 RepID=UPI0024368F3A|nr:uncharacterized protein si:dkey-52l18.4 [Periophthalmus magnuspinnatus]
MYSNLHWAVVCLCIYPGSADDGCFTAVLNRRATFIVASGDSLSLSCVVQHCGHPFTWRWVWTNSTDEEFSSVQSADHLRVTREDLSPAQTRLVLDLLRVREENEGSYGCSVRWETHETEQGHLMFVNVTAARPFDRTLNRILICSAAVLCVFIALGLVFCLRSKVTPQTLRRKFTSVTSSHAKPRPSAETHAPLQQSTPRPPPRRQAREKDKMSSTKTPGPSPQKTEVVYADISQDALVRQQQRRRLGESPQPTVYSSVRFTQLQTRE